MTALQQAEKDLHEAAARLFDAVIATQGTEESRQAWTIAQQCERALRDVADVASAHHDWIVERLDGRRAS